jgi:peptidoglycan/xylan/chitin deacetylase (PgdA/CDA1 family)
MYIFNFHHVEPTPTHVSRKNITITPEGLTRFIRTIRQLGMEPISLKDVLMDETLLQKKPLSAIITFDDGYENVYRYAVPVLREEDCPATIFVLPGKFSGTNDWDQFELPIEQRDRLMSLSQMQDTGSSGLITFGSHGMEHRNLASLSESEISYEIHESFSILTETLGHKFLPVLAYPWGSYSPNVLKMMKNTSYRFAFTTKKGKWRGASPLFEVPRYSIYYRDGSPIILLAKFCRNGLPFFSLDF